MPQVHGGRMENGHYDGQFEKLQNLVEDIDDRTRQHTSFLGSMTSHLEQIAAHTGAVAKHYEAVQTDNRNLTGYLVKILLWVLAAVTAYLVSNNLKSSGLDIKLPWLGIEITQHEPKPE